MGKSKFKRLAMLSSIALLTTALVSACGTDEKHEAAGTNADPQPVKKYTISWVAGQSTPVVENAKMVNYWNEKLNIQLDVWNVESKDYNELMNLKFASGEIPDRMLAKGFTSLQKYVDQDLLAEIPLDMLKKYAPNVYEKTEKEFPNAFDYAKINGKIYGIPQLSLYDRFRSPIVWRGDWLENVGITKSPETLEEFESALYKMRNEDPDKNNQKDTYGISQSGLTSIYGAFGYLPDRWSERDGKLVYGAIQPEMKDALQLLNKWYKDEVIDPEFLTGENNGGYWALSHAFINGRIALSSQGMYYHWKPLLFEGDSASHDYVELKKVNAAAADALVYGMPPKGPNGKMGAPQGSMLNGSFVVFGKQLEKDSDKLAKVLQIIDEISASTYENYVTAMYGIEGEDWNFTDDKKIPVLKEGVTSQDLEAMGANNVIESLELPEFSAIRNQINVHWASDKGFEKGGIRNQLLTALPAQSKYEAELKKLQEQVYMSIITGDKPLSEFDEFVMKWRSNGGEQIEKEANEWFSSIKK